MDRGTPLRQDHGCRQFPPPTRAMSRTGSAMELTALLTFIVIAGFIWGGLAFLMYTAVRKERYKSEME